MVSAYESFYGGAPIFEHFESTTSTISEDSTSAEKHLKKAISHIKLASEKFGSNEDSTSTSGPTTNSKSGATTNATTGATTNVTTGATTNATSGATINSTTSVTNMTKATGVTKTSDTDESEESDESDESDDDNSENIKNYKENFSGSQTVSNNDLHLTTTLLSRAQNVNILLKSLLFACIFYVLAHPDTYKKLKKVINGLTPENGLYLCMFLFAVCYYIINLLL